ncbi:DNA mismatch repair protein [Balamuthia mandrillaris]
MEPLIGDSQGNPMDEEQPRVNSSNSSGSSAPRPIKKLDPTVVNRIAAGEVILRPANALKEMMENSLDAGATLISILAKEGGIKLLQITDNGHGIQKDDMNIVCERFTTSKLQAFEDLRNIATYGFRGEALASVSHVAHVTITSMTEDSPVAYKARYADGKIVPSRPGELAEPKPCAGQKGTQITVEDLFYSVVTRRKAMRNPTEEFNRISDVVIRYAIHNPKVGFTLKKHGQNAAVVHTQPNSTVQDNIRLLFGAEIARELLPVSAKDPGLQFQLEGFVSNANYNRKKSVFILFINHRLVDSTAIKRTLEGVYSNYLPKNTHPFIYLDLQMAPQNVDVNVHPTKKEVHFLHEDTILDSIQKAVENQLLGSNSSRTFYTQASYSASSGVGRGTSSTPSNSGRPVPMLSATPTSGHSGGSSLFDSSGSAAASPMGARTPIPSSSSSSATPSATGLSTPQRSLVRTDDRMQTLHSFLTPAPSPARPSSSSASPFTASGGNESSSLTQAYLRRPATSRAAPPVMLTSVRNLLRAVERDVHEGLAEMFCHHTFVGCVDSTIALIQHRTKLYLCKLEPITTEFMYQEILRKFASFAAIRFTKPISIPRLLMLALDSPDSGWQEEDGPKEDIVKYIVSRFVEKSAMLREYFKLDIDKDANLLCLPQIIDNYIPDMSYLPVFMLHLGSCEWEEEQNCFDSVSRELAAFYSIKPREEDIFPSSSSMETTNEMENGSPSSSSASSSSASSSDEGNDRHSFEWRIEHVIFPALRSFLPPRKFCNDGTVIQIAQLENLYKIFERC